MNTDDSTKSESEQSLDIVPPTAEDKTAIDAKKEEHKDKTGEAAFKEMPPEIKRQVQAFMATFQSQSRSPINPLFDKFNEAHIDKYLDYIQRDDDNAHEIRKSNRWFYLAYFVMTLVALGTTIAYLLPKDKALLETIIQILLALAGGIGAGYGLSKRGNKD